MKQENKDFDFSVMPILIDIKEIKFPVGVGTTQFVESGIEGSFVVHRSIGTKELLKYAKEFDIPFSHTGIDKILGGLPGESSQTQISYLVGDIKAECIRYDASTLKAMGYKKIWFRENAQGGTSISYNMWGEK